ncbi:LysE family transporter [Alphaproteobacteria bacterium GH1-50]|uniref:LysE family transporter n=1 Tax=Kangsaoukella pontilimi TaxID=2691042 RepID=A0A7C9MBK3_9RHOB|nr:LysE/ArgO family amino acid transporter [Kangsaoukella pontilimi]MXQ06512.1 LysE family transporter [Kangsaoukella pontilimi]
MGAYLAGFALSASLILAIGAQNAFVLRQGLKGSHVGLVVAICCLSEFILIFAGVAGFGALVGAVPEAERWIKWAGAGFLAVYGAMSLRAALGPPKALDPAANGVESAGRAAATCLALTWLNPHVYLDTVVFLGSVASGYGAGRWAFGTGAFSASAVFFLALGYGARLLQPVFASPTAWRVLDGGMALLMWSLAVLLVTS